MTLRIILVFVLSGALSVWMHRDTLQRDIYGLHDWRQSQTMWNIRNFARYDNDLYTPRRSSFNGSNNNVARMEFPIMQWGIAQVARLVGAEDELVISRVSVFIISLSGLVAFFLLLRAMAFPPWIAVAGTVLLQFNPLFYFYSVNVLPDLFALAAGLWYLYFSFAYFRDRRWWQCLLAAVLLGLATLAKLPFAILGIVGGVYIATHLYRDRRFDWSVVAFAVVHLICALPALQWYTWVIPTWNNNPVVYGIFGNTNDRAENRRIFYFYWRQYIPYDLLSPAVWLYFLVGCWRPLRPPAPTPYARYVWAMALITLLYVLGQFNTITTVHDYYLFPLLPWMYIVVTAGLGRVWQWIQERPITWVPRAATVAVAVSILISPLLAHQLNAPKRDERIGAYYEQLKDVRRYRAELQAVTDHDSLVIALNDHSGHVFTWLIRKRGYVFSSDAIKPAWIDDMRRRGVTHLYSNSRRIDQDSAFQTRFDSLVLERGNVKVFRLK